MVGSSQLMLLVNSSIDCPVDKGVDGKRTSHILCWQLNMSSSCVLKGYELPILRDTCSSIGTMIQVGGWRILSILVLVSMFALLW